MVFNTARVEALEVETLIECAQATMVSAAARRDPPGVRRVRSQQMDADQAHEGGPRRPAPLRRLRRARWELATVPLQFSHPAFEIEDAAVRGRLPADPQRGRRVRVAGVDR